MEALDRVYGAKQERVARLPMEVPVVGAAESCLVLLVLLVLKAVLAVIVAKLAKRFVYKKKSNIFEKLFYCTI